MKKEVNNNSKFYYPYCRESRCNGVLKIKINDNYTLDYECDENINHKGNKIYFKNFENNYLIENNIEKCFICKKYLEKEFKFKCNICNKFYCPDICFLYDEHIKNNLSNLSITNNKCSIHKQQFSFYCIDCKKYLCKYCMKDDNILDMHKKNDHAIQNLIQLIPSKNEINDFIYKIDKISKNYENIINSIEQWEKQLINKSEKLKRGLKSQIELFKKMFLNYNQYFHNYAYYSNFNIIKNYLNSFNEENKDLFNSCHKFEKQTKILMNFFKKMDKNMPIKYEIKYYPIEENTIVTKLNENFFIEYRYNYDKIYLHNYINKKVKVINHNEQIFSLFNSIKNKQVYACLSDTKKIIFFDYNLEKGWIKLSKNEIEDNIDINNNFNKCIDISDDYLASSDEVSICIWGKEKLRKEKKGQKYEYRIINRIMLNEKTIDLLFINNEYFISAQPDNNSITYINTNSLEIDKIILNIDCTDSTDCLYLLKNQIIIKCFKGIAIISVKTKELIQYIKMTKNCLQKKLFYDENSVFILNKYRLSSEMKIIEYKLIDNCLATYMVFPNLTFYENDVDIFLMNKKNLVLFYIGEKDNNNNENYVDFENPNISEHENKCTDGNDENEEEDEENNNNIDNEEEKENTEEEKESNEEELKI